MKRSITLVCLFIFAGSAGAQEHSVAEEGHHSSMHGSGHTMESESGERESGGMHSMIRHHYVMQEGLPQAYRDLSNPLSATDSTLANGRRIYAENCAICHGETGLGDGPGGLALDPSPSNIQQLPRMPMMSSDAYLYWTVAEGGVPIETGMTPFGQLLTSADIWSVILYLREGL